VRRLIRTSSTSRSPVRAGPVRIAVAPPQGAFAELGRAEQEDSVRRGRQQRREIAGPGAEVVDQDRPAAVKPEEIIEHGQWHGAS
jgi:hypothetical protein